MDILESNAYGDDPDPAPEQDDTWTHPKTLGLTALALAVLALFGAGAMRGASYTLLLGDSGFQPQDDTKHLLIAGAFVSAALALIPVLLARLGLARLVPDDGPWAGHVLRAALLLGGLAVLLDLVRALMALVNGDLSTIQVLF